jgi:phenylpropionate dioxygenase-like ring-hydroxylating dioxygenase large terminal subunit
MSMLDHWHPVVSGASLRDRPLGVRLAGKEIVLFRSEGGKVGALEDNCPHRHMRLSLGKVVKHRLQCPYHGWTFACDGAGESPGTPKLYACANRFDALERHGTVWVKSADSAPELPPFDVAGYFHIGTLYHQVQAPLELALDNFCEIEHTPTTHAFFGYALERMHEVRVCFETTDTTVRVLNAGPPKRIAPLLRLLLGIGRGYEFRDDWTTHFSPVYSVYDHWFEDPATGRESLVRWRLYIFFTPLDDQHTALTTFAFTRSRYPGPNGGARLFRRYMLRHLDHEIRLDVRILENLVDKRAGIEGMRLSRFDKVLGLNRERIERIYRGRQAV